VRQTTANRIRARLDRLRLTACAGAGSAASPRLDVVAGLTAAALVVPKAMGYAAVAGLPVVVGLYTAFVPLIVYAALGSSRVMSVSTTSTLAILAGTELASAVPDGDGAAAPPTRQAAPPRPAAAGAPVATS
jgi:MFS superfamily sulfate permease-like transporter